ncbi:hypothetical protein M433DRAFT_76237 [Acidomyces richmondensis BFW]|nr:hypothetical protein M433DRAFT_76237 [Acidomyces richmondensis BFW]
MQFQGFAKLNLAAFDFARASAVGHRDVDNRNVARLVNIFQLEGCKREESDNIVDALIDASEQRIDLPQYLPNDCKDIPTISFNTVQCLNGLHRLLAARQHLDANDQWWIARLFSKGNYTPYVCVAVTEEYKNEFAYADGEIFRKIRLYNKSGDARAEKKWWARLSKTKAKDLRQLLKDERYNRVFDDMLPWPGIWAPIRLGSLHRLPTMKCDEAVEILNYLNHIVTSWASILAELKESFPQDLDTSTVQQLETLAPAFSSHDEALVRSLMERNKIFSTIHDRQDRNAILQRLLNFPGMIPSLFTFFESLKYLEPCATILRNLLPLKQNRSIYQALSASYFRPQEIQVEYAESDFRPHPRSSPQIDYALAYQQLWLYALRNFVSMTEVTPRKEQKKVKPRICERSPYVWRKFGSLAVILGFETPAARELHSTDAETELSEIISKLFGAGNLQNEAIAEIAQILRSLPTFS